MINNGIETQSQSCRIAFPGVVHVDELLPLNLLARGQAALIEQIVGQSDQVHRRSHRDARAWDPMHRARGQSETLLS